MIVKVAKVQYISVDEKDLKRHIPAPRFVDNILESELRTLVTSDGVTYIIDGLVEQYQDLDAKRAVSIIWPEAIE